MPTSGKQNCKILVPKTGAFVDVSISCFFFKTEISLQNYTLRWNKPTWWINFVFFIPQKFVQKEQLHLDIYILQITMISGQGYFYIANEIYPNSAYNNFTLVLNDGLSSTPGRVPVPYPGRPEDPDPMPVYCSVVNNGDTPITVKSAMTTPGKIFCSFINRHPDEFQINLEQYTYFWCRHQHIKQYQYNTTWTNFSILHKSTSNSRTRGLSYCIEWY